MEKQENKISRRGFIKRLVILGGLMASPIAGVDFMIRENKYQSAIDSVNPDLKGEERLKLRQRLIEQNGESNILAIDALVFLSGFSIAYALAMPVVQNPPISR